MPNNSGISEIIGALILIGIFAGLIAVVTVYVTSQVPKEKIPAIDFDIKNDSQTIRIYNLGGDSIYGGDSSNINDPTGLQGSKYRIAVYDQDGNYYIDNSSVKITSSFKSNKTENYNPGNFTNGVILTSNGAFLGDKMPSKVDVIYRTNDGNEVLLYSRKLESFTSPPTPTSTPSAIPTPTSTPSITGSIFGTVTKRDGTSMYNIPIILTYPNSTTIVSYSKSDGSFSFSSIPINIKKSRRIIRM